MEMDDRRNGDMMPLGEIEREPYLDEFYYKNKIEQSQNIEKVKNYEQIRKNESKNIRMCQDIKAMFVMLLNDGNEENNQNVTTNNFGKGTTEGECYPMHTYECKAYLSELNETEKCLEYQNKEECYPWPVHTDECKSNLSGQNETEKCLKYQNKENTDENKYLLSELNENESIREHQKKENTDENKYLPSELNENENIREHQKEARKPVSTGAKEKCHRATKRNKMKYKKKPKRRSQTTDGKIRMSEHKTREKERCIDEPQRKKNSRKKMLKRFIQATDRRRILNLNKGCLYEADVSRLKSGYSLQQNTCYSNRRLCSVLFVLLFACPVDLTPVDWSLKNAPVEFGSTAILECHSQEMNGCNYLWRWTKGDLQTLISYDGFESNTTKYKEVLGENCTSSLLYIKGFTVDDVNVNYTCFHGFHQKTKRLELHENIFKSLPTDDNTKALVMFDRGMLVSNVMFKRLFPVPHCSFIMQNMSVSNNASKIYDQSGFFVNVNYSIAFKLDLDSCRGTLNGICRFGTTGKYVFHQTFDFCTDFNTDEHTSYVTEAIVIILVIAFVIVLVVLLIARKTCLQKKTGRQRGYSCVHFNQLAIPCSTRNTECRNMINITNSDEAQYQINQSPC